MKPPDYNPEKNKFKEKWCKLFLKRNGLSIRRKTNKKKQSIFEKLHKIKNYHHYTVFQLADEDISSEESEEEEESEAEEESEEASSDSEDNSDSEDTSELITSDEDSFSESD
jgi:hypothetical protein